MIKHIKSAKSSVPILPQNNNRKKVIKKILSSCGTPRKVFSKSTSRNGSPCPKTARHAKKLTVQVSKTKTNAASPRLKFGILHSYISPLASLGSSKKLQKLKKSKTNSKNLSPKTTYKTENTATSGFKDPADVKDKNSKLKQDHNSVNHLKTVLKQITKENIMLKNRLKGSSDSQEEPKAIMNSNTIDSVINDIKTKLNIIKIRLS
jgi:hypothetical protein